eukprot:c20733_g1_i9.p1 GENE.c20733_g1_i9~~c20733_g1_i9.p1  ORF type:complete len:145 (+),score=15.76 c20733_g1_i9:40-474(+)
MSRPRRRSTPAPAPPLNADAVLCDMSWPLSFRGSFDGVVSVSALQWLCDGTSPSFDRLNTAGFGSSLPCQSPPDSALISPSTLCSFAVFQFYPTATVTPASLCAAVAAHPSPLNPLFNVALLVDLPHQPPELLHRKSIGSIALV